MTVLQDAITDADNLQTFENKIDALIDIVTVDEEQLELDQQNVSDTKELIEKMSDNIQTLNKSLGEGSENQLLEYQELSATLQELSTGLETLNTTALYVSDFVEIASNAIVTYSIFYIPLIVIIYALWWFFKQFLTDFR